MTLHRTQLFVAAVALALAPLAMGCGGGEAAAPPTTSITAPPTGEATPAAADGTISTVSNMAPLVESSAEDAADVIPESQRYPLVVIKTSLGEITVKLDAVKAPQTVANFLDNYVRRDFYTNTQFHYVEQGFMVIGGGFDAQNAAKEARAPVINEADNGLSNRRGTIAMVRSPEYIHGATSQFFFNLADNQMLDHKGGDLLEIPPQDFGYCVFGEVIQGMEVVDKIGGVPVQDTPEFLKHPVQTVIIQSITVVE